MTDYEYNTIQVSDPYALEERANQLADHGWRVVEVMYEDMYTDVYALLEREVDADD